MADCGMSPVGCLTDIAQSIFTECLWPPIKRHIDYWWCFDNNIQDLTDGIRDLNRETLDIDQQIEDARLDTYKLRPEVEEWLKAGTKKLGEASRILQDDINPKAWNLISRYSMGKRAKKAAEEIAKHQNDGNKFNAIADPPPPPAMGCTTDRSIMEFESRKHIEEDIIKSLKESGVGMIGICGMGGVGKTTMAQRIRETVMKEKEKIFDEVVMVVVSQPIDMLKIQKEVAELLGLKFDVESLRARADKLRTRLMDTKRKIVIFDDVWERFKLGDLGVPSGFEGCKILLTTRSKDVCKKMEVEKIIEIETLSEKEAWILFKEKAGNCVEDTTLLSIAKDVAAECKGLPIALVTVGKALQNQEKSIWEDSLSQLRRANPRDFPEVLADVYKPLKLSYDYLDNERERFLFLLCCLFPEDYNIPVEELTLYFMGLQIFDDIIHIEEARNRMRRLIANLKSRFMLIDGEKKHHVKMHDVVRDVAIYIGSKEKDCSVKSLNKISIENSSDINCNWMSVDISNEPMNGDMGLRFPKLRFLMLLPLRSDISLEGNLSSDTSLEGITDLNVLSFSNMQIGGSLPPTLASLQNLRTLYFYRCKVEDISVIGELLGLEILYCHGCYEIKELPAEIGKLNLLRLLDLNGCNRLQRIAFGILSSLVGLEELKMLRSFDGWEAEENGKEKRNASLRELESLPNLSCLEIEICDSNLAAQQIRLSPKLVKYCIRIGSRDYSTEERNYEKEMELKLPSEIGGVGKWIQNLVKNTEYLFLQGDGSNNINLEECQVNLRNLRVWECSTLKKVVKTKDCKSGIVFPMLERLYLWNLTNLEEIWDGTIILNQNLSLFYNLKSIKIYRCSKLRYLLSVSVGTTCLLQLEELEIYDCSAMEQVFMNDITYGCIGFPKLKKLTLYNLPNLTAFCQGFENINFPQLTDLEIGEWPKLNSFCPLNSETPHDDSNPFHFFCNPKVEIGDLKTLIILGFNSNNTRNIWCHQIPINFFNNLQDLKIYNINGIRSLMSYSIAKNLVSLKDLLIMECEEMVEVIEGNDDDKEVVDIKCLFPTLKTLEFEELSKLRRFCEWNHALELPLLERVRIKNCPLMETFTLGSLNTPKLKALILVNLPNFQGIENINFPQLTYLAIGGLPKLNSSFCPLNSETGNGDTNSFHFLCNPKVEIGGLKTLSVCRFNYNNIRNIWCHQIPINFFNNLQELKINYLKGFRSLMSYSIAKDLVSLKDLNISNCEEMVEVIECNDDDDKEVVDIKCLFPTLKRLVFHELHKLRKFWQLNYTLELPLLEKVIIWNCRVMETFTLGSLNTPNLMELVIDFQSVDMKNLNDIPHHYFMTKNQNTSMIDEKEQHENEDANKDDDKDENKIEYNNENVGKYKDKNEHVNNNEDKGENNIEYNNENVNKD